jgi:selT/selW/selH-like putative selenoprotein
MIFLARFVVIFLSVLMGTSSFFMSMIIPKSPQQGLFTMGSTAPQARLEIQYCGGCGFERYYLDIKAALDARFPGRIEVVPIKDEDLTGNFEVTLLDTRQLIHSKTKKGMGKCESPAERESLFAIVDVYLKFLDKKKPKPQ